MESNEPPYAECDYAALVAAFPEGDYAVRGLNTDGSLLRGTAHFTTVVPLAPKFLAPHSTRDEGGDLPTVPHDGLTVRWEPVSESRDGRPVEIVG